MFVWSLRLLVLGVGHNWGFICFSISVHYVVFYNLLLYACGCDVSVIFFLVIVSVSNGSRVEIARVQNPKNVNDLERVHNVIL